MKKQVLIVLSVSITLLLILLYIIYNKNKAEKISNNINSKAEEQIQQNNNMVPIEELPENYTWQQAVEDGCLVRANSSQIYNTDLLDEFLQKVKNNEACFIRYTIFTIEGNMIITDVSFEGNDIFKVCRDSTREKYSSQEDRKYSYCTFTEIVVEELDEGVKVNLTGAIEGEIYSIYIPGYEKNDEKINKH